MNSSKLPVLDSKTKVVTFSKGESGDPDIRKFDSTALNDQISKLLEMLPKDKKVAAIGYIDLKGANLAIVGRIKGNLDWTVMVSKPWKEGLEASAALRWSI